MAVSFVAGDTGSVLRVTCTNGADGAPIVLTTVTPTLSWTDSNGMAQTRTMTVVDAVNGVCQYQFAAGELEWPEISLTIRLTDASGAVVRSLNDMTYPVKE